MKLMKLTILLTIIIVLVISPMCFGPVAYSCAGPSGGSQSGGQSSDTGGQNGESGAASGSSDSSNGGIGRGRGGTSSPQGGNDANGPEDRPCDWMIFGDDCPKKSDD